MQINAINMSNGSMTYLQRTMKVISLVDILPDPVLVKNQWVLVRNDEITKKNIKILTHTLTCKQKLKILNKKKLTITISNCENKMYIPGLPIKQS